MKINRNRHLQPYINKTREAKESTVRSYGTPSGLVKIYLCVESTFISICDMSTRLHGIKLKLTVFFMANTVRISKCKLSQRSELFRPISDQAVWWWQHLLCKHCHAILFVSKLSLFATLFFRNSSAYFCFSRTPAAFRSKVKVIFRYRMYSTECEIQDTENVPLLFLSDPPSLCSPKMIFLTNV